jgi:aminopeptidase N
MKRGNGKEKTMWSWWSEAFKSLFVILFVLLSVAPAFPYANEGVIDCTLEISFDIQASKVIGHGTIPLKKGQEIRLDKGKLNLISVTLNKEKMDTSIQGEKIRIVPLREGTVEVGFEGIFKSEDREKISSVIDGNGMFLTGTWYPKPDQMCYYRLTATLPDGYEAVSEAETITKTAQGSNTLFAFDFPHPLDSINFIATNRYKIVSDRFDGVEILAYFFPEDLDLVKTYIEHAKHYLKLYDHLISKFPYKRFSIVENFLPTGYSMPTYTLLGQEVLRLPFIPETSLGHEILHQWFGNLVYIDYSKGNWAEGLTTFLADHLYEEEKGRGAEYRKGALINYQSYVNAKNDFPLKDFRERTGNASEAIGYGKALMVFQMLKKMVGEKRFYESVRYFTDENHFRKASWADIKAAFEEFYQKDLSWFFNQWIDEKGLPDLRFEEVKAKPSGAKFETTFTVVQKGKKFILDVPVALHSYFSKATDVFHLQKEKERFQIMVEDIPEKMTVDEDYDVARMLSVGEFPPVIARLLGDEQRIIVSPLTGSDIYEEVIHAFKGKEGSVKGPDEIKYIEPGDAALVLLGVDNPVVGRLYGSVQVRGGFSVLMKDNPWKRSRAVGIVNARSKEEVEAAFQKIFHYGKYSEVSFDHGINIHKKIDQSTRGITEELLKKAVAVEISTLKSLPDVMTRVADKKIIYVGENHDQFSNHVMELEVIKDLHRRGKIMAIGMEMFQRPFQKVLDDYIEGKIDEREFLKGTQYFKRWGFDYHLYRPILLFARSEKIPVVALNQRQGMVDKVFRSGLDSLSEEERRSIPSGMDFSDEAYKERLEKVFQEHEDFGAKDFNFFYQAQILWDETMAESIDEFLKAHPGYQMVVLAGNGHLSHGSGIPKRTARRNGYDYAIILNDADLKKDIADYVLFPGSIPFEASPRLMVLLTEKRGKVEVAGFPPKSNSEKAGIRAGDIILSVDHTPIHEIDDLKIDLLSRKKGERVKVRVLRKGLFGSQKMDFEVVLQ